MNGLSPEEELHAGLASLYQSKDYSDLTLFDRDGSRHRVHKAIVYTRSDFLRDAVVDEGVNVRDLFAPGVFHKTERLYQHDCIWLSEEAEIVRMVVEYLYLLDYGPTLSTTNDCIVRTGSHSSVASSIRSNAASYGQIYGMSAVCAFGGPSIQPQLGPPTTSNTLSRSNTAMTAHALPLATLHRGVISHAAGRRSTSLSNSDEPVTAPEPSPPADIEPHLILHMKVYAAAHKYGIKSLRSLALEKLTVQLERHHESQELLDVVKMVCSVNMTDDAALREVLLDTLSRHPVLLDKPEIDSVVKGSNGMAYELLKRSMGRTL
jgi:hypothetical protein